MADYSKRGENSWRLTVSLGTGPDGKKIRERETITIDDPAILKSPKKLEQYLNEEWMKFKIKVQSGAYISPQKMKLSDFIGEWREKYATDPRNLSPATLSNYENVIQVRLIPYFGHMRVDQITALHIVTFLKELEKPGMRRTRNNKKPLTEAQQAAQNKPLDSGTIGFIYRVLKNILSRAVDWKLISENPMSGIPKPAPTPEEAKQKVINKREDPQFYDENEAQLVVDALYKETRKWRLLILGSMIGGWRRGELVGFEWPYAIFSENVIRVDNNIPLTKNGKPVEKGPKSVASYRDTDMPEWYMKELQDYYDEWIRERKKLKDKWQGGDREFVFHNGNGAPYYYQHPSKWWKRFCARHKIRYIKFHGLRHSSGTLLLEDESETSFDSILIAIQRRLGHARLSTTSDIYVHETKKVKKRTAGKFDKFARSCEQEVESIGVSMGSENHLRMVK